MFGCTVCVSMFCVFFRFQLWCVIDVTSKPRPRCNHKFPKGEFFSQGMKHAIKGGKLPSREILAERPPRTTGITCFLSGNPPPPP